MTLPGLPKSRINDLIAAVQSIALKTGHFTGVFRAEPMGAAGIDQNGLTCGVWVDDMVVLPGRGLASSSVLLGLFVRTYSAAIGVEEYRDEIDPRMMNASADLFSLFIGGFTLSGFATSVDVKGQYGTPLGAKSGHLTLDKKIFRVYDTIVPLIVDDLWVEAP